MLVDLEDLIVVGGGQHWRHRTCFRYG
jgi:hypothetical protein